ncbi:MULTISPECIES: hypothetical protein [unclassified Asaia]|uniref:hypothetical protein n=1 Tax=unclassified Asaia TaxID=2685023 RepID=UPI000F8F2564|nr:hypothetical protein [Asaia sp. W19]
MSDATARSIAPSLRAGLWCRSSGKEFEGGSQSTESAVSTSSGSSDDAPDKGVEPPRRITRASRAISQKAALAP